MLINESESMHNVCYFCFSAKKNTGVKTCKSCLRFTHVHCLQKKKLVIGKARNVNYVKKMKNRLM